MPELRKDPIIDRWVIISTERGKRPIFFVEETPPSKVAVCPLCPGNENMTPPEVYVVRPTGSSPGSPDWSLRVVPNKFPALRIEGDLVRSGGRSRRYLSSNLSMIHDERKVLVFDMVSRKTVGRCSWKSGTGALGAFIAHSRARYLRVK